MDTLTSFCFRLTNRPLSLHGYATKEEAVRAAEDVHGVDNPAVEVVKVSTTFEVVT